MPELSLSEYLRRARQLVPGWIRRRYAAKFAVGFALVILAIALIGGVTYVETDRQLQETTEDRLETQSDLQGMVLDNWVNEVRGDARTLASARTVARDSNGGRSRFLQRQLQVGTFADSVRAVHYVEGPDAPVQTVDANGTVSISGTDDLPWAEFVTDDGSNSEATQWSQLSGGSTLSTTAKLTRPYVSPVTGRPALAVFKEIDTTTANDAVVLVVDLGTAAESLERDGGSGRTVVVDGQGTVVMSDRTEEIASQHMGPEDEASIESEAVRRAFGGESGYVEKQVDGQTLSVGYAPVAEANWTVTSQVPRGTAFSLQRDISTGLLLLLGTTVVGFLLIGLTLGRGTVESIETLADRAAELESGNLEADLETRREDEIGALFGAFDSMRGSLRETIEEAESARERAEVERERSERLVEHLEEKADAYRETMAATAAGDLTRRMDPDSESEAMTEIGEAFNEMADELESTIASVTAFATTVADASETVTASAEEVRNASEEVTGSVQEISDGANRQSDSLREASIELDDLSATIEEIASSTDEVANTSREAAELGTAGRSAAEEALEEMAEIESRAEETAEAVARLNDEMDEVGEIVELIDGIAEQTGTLALNASIEAARAGEAGAGFAVVAEEVKSLAEETKEATREIDGRIEELRTHATESASDVRRMRDGVGEGAETVAHAADALQEIVDAVEDANAGIQEVDDATDEQASSTQEVVSMVEDVSETSERVSAESETVAAAAEEQTASLVEVTESAKRLADRADELGRAVETFTVSSDAAGPEEPRASGREFESPADD